MSYFKKNKPYKQILVFVPVLLSGCQWRTKYQPQKNPLRPLALH